MGVSSCALGGLLSMLLVSMAVAVAAHTRNNFIDIVYMVRTG